MIGVRGYGWGSVDLSVVGGKGRFAAHSISMSPMHSAGPCLHSISEESLVALEGSVSFLGYEHTIAVDLLSDKG